MRRFVHNGVHDDRRDGQRPRNVISGNLGNGINILTDAVHVLVQGNIIGLDASGMQFLGNKGDGVGSNAPFTTIGGRTPRPQHHLRQLR